MNDDKDKSNLPPLEELVAEVKLGNKKPKKGYNRNVSPKSLSNLKPMKPGETRNPKGYNAKGRKQKALIKLSNEELNRLTALLLQSTLGDLEAIRANPDSTMLELALVAIAYRIVIDGDAKALETLINRPLGKPTENINYNNSNTVPQVIITLPSNMREVPSIETSSTPITRSLDIQPEPAPKKLAIRYGPKIPDGK